MIALAKDDQKEEMALLWHICFGDSMNYIRNFFSRRFDPSGAMIYLANRKVVSMLFMLPAVVRMNGGHEPAQYIYAVCTHPDYRKRGIMRALMEAAWDQALKRGERFSVLLPASDELYLYYGDMGYLEYFKRRRVEGAFADSAHSPAPHTPARPRSWGGSGHLLLDPAPERIHRIRQSLFGEREGTVLWDEPAAAYAISALEVYGGRIRCFEYEGRQGYVMGYVDKAKDTAVIQETAAAPGLWLTAARVVAEHFPAAFLQWSLPADLNLSGESEASGGLSRLAEWTITAESVERWGVIRPLDEGAALDLERSRERVREQAPYLGMALD
jgi:GNAT superfamily N-acetyltransferase